MKSPIADYAVARSLALAVVARAGIITRTIQRAARTSSERAAQHPGTDAVDSLAKPDASPVTVADYAVQAYVSAALHAQFPSDRFIAEESSAALRADPALLDAVVSAVSIVETSSRKEPSASSSDPLDVSLDAEGVLDAIDRCATYDGPQEGRVWVLDPIDGTRGFVAQRQYCIALALTDNGIPKIGILGCPNLPADALVDRSNGADPTRDSDEKTGVVFHAIVGSGAFSTRESHAIAASRGRLDWATAGPEVDSKRVSVSDLADPAWTIFCESVETKHSSHELSARVASILGVKATPVRMDSQAKYGAMARGDFHIFMRFPKSEYVENVWDHAAGVVVVEEAGGKVTDGRGRPLDFTMGRKLDNDDGIVATNGHIHDAVVGAVQKALAEQNRLRA